mgnify:FL=1
MLRYLLISLIFMSCAASIPAQQKNEIPVWQDKAVTAGSAYEPTMACYLPETPNGITVMICPGGGYEYQSDRESEPIALEFLKRGYQAFILEYAVLEENETKGLLPYPQMDLAKAVAYVKEHQEVWNVDGEQITILGCSAGGNLCALYSGFYQQDWFIKKTGYRPETNDRYKP